MSSHILDPIKVALARLRPADRPTHDPLLAFLDGMQVPDHLVGKPFDVTDIDGNVVATTRRPIDPTVASMLG